MEFIRVMFFIDYEEPTSERLGKLLTVFEQCLLTMIWIETDMDQDVVFSGLSMRRFFLRQNRSRTFNSVYGKLEP